MCLFAYVSNKLLGTFEERVSTEIALEVVIFYCEQKCSQIAILIHVFEG